ncbi:hypothetical protein ONZ45_g6699 [Pleurotus djamor]|nr:hypothetical protein ONZ45_g6699 [Pleurotus djamor]
MPQFAAAMQDLEDGDASLREVPLTLTLLKSRRDMGLPIKRYTIKNCILTPTQVETLRRFVEVDWDGIEDGDEALDDT